MTKTSEHDITARCRFGNLSVGAEEKAALGVTIERADSDYSELAEIVVGGRLDVLVRYDPIGRDDADGQQKLTDTAVELTGIADCASLSIKRGTLTFRLSFAVGSVDAARLIGAAQMAGLLSMSRIGDAGETGDDE